MIKRQLPLFLAVLLLLALGNAALAQDAPIDLRISWWGSQSRHDATIKVIEMYQEANPNVNITYEYANFNDYWTRVNTEAAGGGLACVMQHDYAYLADWAKRGLLMPLDPYIEQGLIDASKIDDSYLAGGRVDGKLYGLNLGVNSQSIIIDTDAFEKAGIDLPPAQWTWAEFEQITTELHDKLGIWGYGSPSLGDDQIWTGLYNSLGMTPFNADGTALGYTDDQPLIDHFKMILRLQDAKAIATPEESAQFTGPETSPIVTGQAAMQYQWSNQVVAIFSAAGESRHFKLWMMPRAEADHSANYIKPSMFFAIPSTCDQPEAAARFINYFTNDLAANEVLKAERGVPVSSAVRDDLKPALDPVGVETFDFLEQVGQDSTPIFPPNPPGYNDIRNNVYLPMFSDPVLYGQISVEEGVQTLRDQSSDILSQNKS